MKRLILFVSLVLPLLVFAKPALAINSPPEILEFTGNTLNIITMIATAATVFFIIKGGYLYITSTGNPEVLDQAKKTIRNAVIGLILVLGAGVIISIFNNALPGGGTSAGQSISMPSITTTKPTDGLTQVLIDAVTAFLQNIIESATKPIVDGAMGFLTSTPSLLNNSVIMNFWLVCVGIVDSLFIIAVALIGLQVMSATSFGFEDVDVRQVLPRVGLAFIGANVSLFLADYAIVACNALVSAVLNSTGGLNHAWVADAVNPATLISGTTPLIILVFLILFLIVSIVLLLMYISRLIIISVGAVLSPFVFLLLVLPKTADMAEAAIRSYLVTVFTVFVHVIIIQLSASYLTLPGNSNNSLISISVAIGLFFVLMKVPSLMMQLVMHTTNNGMVKKLGGQIINVMSSGNGGANVAKGVDIIKTSRKIAQL